MSTTRTDSLVVTAHFLLQVLLQYSQEGLIVICGNVKPFKVLYDIDAVLCNSKKTASVKCVSAES